jgi:NhaP-type Na+/H+ and K+/H+ antiporter
MLDDLSHMKVLDKPWFVSLCLRHRHIAGGVSLSMIIICQSLHGGLSRVVRQNCSLICLFSTHDKTALDDLYRECSHLLDQDEFEALFHAATEDFHSFLAVDLSQDDPNKVFSKDLQKWFQIRNSAHKTLLETAEKKDDDNFNGTKK